jgi:hypothetical protein
MTAFRRRFFVALWLSFFGVMVFTAVERLLAGVPCAMDIGMKETAVSMLLWHALMILI